MYCGVALPGSRGGALSLLFFCRRFLFQIKRKCRNAGSIYHLIIVHSEGKKRFLRGFRAAVAAAVRRGRRTLQVAPNRLQISIHQPVLSYYAALYMQKSRQRCVEVAAPYRLRLIDYKSPSTNLFCHIMQLYICKSPGRHCCRDFLLFYKVY